MLHACMEHRQHWVVDSANRSIYQYPSRYDDYYYRDADDDSQSDFGGRCSINISSATHNTGEPSKHHHNIRSAYDHHIDDHYHDHIYYHYDDRTIYRARFSADLYDHCRDDYYDRA